jgi:hypothetical protein
VKKSVATGLSKDSDAEMDCCWNFLKNCGGNAGGVDRQNRGKFHRFLIDFIGFRVFLGFFSVFSQFFWKIFRKKILKKIFSRTFSQIFSQFFFCENFFKNIKSD